MTGATGMVGAWLCEELLRRGASVVALVRDDDPQSRFYTEQIDRRCSVVRGNLACFSDCMRALNTHSIEFVFHLGAQTIVGTALRDPFETLESNIRGTYNLLEAARQLRPLIRAFVFASSDKAYGESETLPYIETMALNGRFPYDVSKSCADLLCTSYAHTYGLPVVIARCGNIYGAGDLNWSRIVPRTMRTLISGERLVLRSDGKSIRDYTYVRDVVNAYIALAQACVEPALAGEAFNVSSETRCSVAEIVEEIGKVLKIKPNPEFVDTATMELREQTLDTTKAKQRLHWTSTWTLGQGLADTASWYRSYLEEPSLSRTG